MAKIEGKHLKDLAGNWNGELTYLDYRDDKSRVTLKVRTMNVWAKPKLTRNVVFTEPNGKEIKSDSILTIADDSRSLLEDKDKWRVVKNIYDRDKNKESSFWKSPARTTTKKPIYEKLWLLAKLNTR